MAVQSEILVELLNSPLNGTSLIVQLLKTPNFVTIIYGQPQSLAASKCASPQKFSEGSTQQVFQKRSRSEESHGNLLYPLLLDIPQLTATEISIHCGILSLLFIRRRFQSVAHNKSQNKSQNNGTFLSSSSSSFSTYHCTVKKMSARKKPSEDLFSAIVADHDGIVDSTKNCLDQRVAYQPLGCFDNASRSVVLNLANRHQQRWYLYAFRPHITVKRLSIKHYIFIFYIMQMLFKESD